MNKYEDMYFHGLAGNIVVINENELVINTSLEQLEKIILTGGIYSRNKLKKYGTEYKHKPVINGDDFISVCVKNPAEEEFTGYNEGFESAYTTYVQSNKISLVIDKKIELTSIFRNPEGLYMLPGERQIKNGVSNDNIVAITIMFDDEEWMQIVVSKVRELLEKYGITVPLLDRNLNEIEIQNRNVM